MARANRTYAESGYYHVVLKGSGGQILFESDEDRKMFLSYLEEMFTRHESSLIAWCLMSNHVHLIVSDAKEEISECIHDLATSYAMYFNRAHERSGSLFHGRFHSVPIESDKQLLCAVRYIHDNPAKAEICAADEYPWSSYQAYVRGRSAFTDTAGVLDLIGGQKNFAAFSRESKYAGYAFKGTGRLNDTDAIELANSVLGIDLGELKAMPISERNACLRHLRDAGLSARQIERLTGIGRGVIARALR